MAWSRGNDKCVSCDTEEWDHKGNGHCSKCYPLIKKKEIIKQWNSADPTTLKAVSPIDKIILEHLIELGKLENAKVSLLRQIYARIYLYTKYNSPGQVDPIAIEYLYERIASITNNVSDQKLFHGAVTRYGANFNNELRKVIYKDLGLILINRKLNLNVWTDII